MHSGVYFLCMQTTVLTPEQMRAKLAGRPMPLTEEDAAKITLRNNSTEKSVAYLQKKIEALAKKPKMTPARMREGLAEMFAEYNFDPVRELMMTSIGTNDESLAVKINMFLTEFFVPKLKSIEVSGTIDHNHSVVIRRFGPGGQVIDTPAPKLGSAVVDAEVDAEVVGGGN